jgi:protoheme IX farnesyltransferase
MRAYHALTKPRVVQLIVFCAVIGMLLASPRLPDWRVALAATVGIWLVAGRRRGVQLPGRAAHRCAHEAHRVAADRDRRADAGSALAFSAILFVLGSALLYVVVNPLTMWLTFATFVGYAVVYTVLLKPLTPQNIVIGGASARCRRSSAGPRFAARSARGVRDVPDHLPVDATALLGARLYRAEDYRKSGLPMLPITHGNEFTRLHVFLYTLVLFAATLLPFIDGMSGVVYLVAAVILGAMFSGYAWRLLRSYSDALARRTFRFSIVYLAALFAALLVDHYLSPLL